MSIDQQKVRLQLDIVEYSPGDQAPTYDLIIGEQTMHNQGVVLDFQEKTMKIDKILLPMKNIANLQFKPRITRAIKENTCFAQEPISTRSATKRVVEILDVKYKKADCPAIIRENHSHLKASDREKLLSVLLRFESLFNGTLGDWNLPPVSFELKEGMKPYRSFGDTIPVPTVARVQFLSSNFGIKYYQLRLPCFFDRYFLVFTYHNF
jgi:hypothetical protein